VEIDTIHRMIEKKKRLYVFVLIDVFSRWIYAKAYERMSAVTAARFVAEAQRHATFNFNMLQSDHGPEFGSRFVSLVRKNHRYTRIGKPNDNAHIERVNRTIQEECLDKLPNDVFKINCELKKYLQYYNFKRLHLGISLRVPIELIQK
jgi:transposase InsO family protein